MNIKEFNQQDAQLFNLLKTEFPKETEHWTETYEELFKEDKDEIRLKELKEEKEHEFEEAEDNYEDYLYTKELMILDIQEEMEDLKEEWDEINLIFEENLEKMKDQVEKLTGERPVYNREDNLQL